MAEGINNLLGGLMTGFVGSKNKAREMATAEEYKKAMTDHVKLQAKIDENKIKLESMKMGMMEPILKQAMGGGMPSPAPQPTMSPPMAQAGPQPLENTIAAAQMPLGGGGINIPGDPANNISVRQNNPFNLKYAGQAEATGPGTRDFAIFPTPEAGVQAGIKQIQLDQSRGLTLSQFANKYAPPFENDTNNWIKNVAGMTGATPDTPIAQIPTLNLAKAVAKVESSATIGGGLGTPQQAMAPPQPQMMTSMTNPQQFQPIRTIDQEDALKAAWKWLTGSELRDKKFDYRINKSGDIMVLQDGQLVNKIDGGPNASWHNLPNGGYALLDTKTRGVLAAIPVPEMVKSKTQLPTGAVGEFWEPKGGGAAGGMEGAGSGIPGLTITERPKQDLPGTLPESARTKIADNNAIVDQLNILQSNFKPEYVGAKGLIGQGADYVSGVVPGVGDPTRRTWNQVYNEMLGQKLHTRGGSALTKQEIAYVMNTLPLISHNPALFKSGIEAAKMLIQASNYELLSSHLTPDKAKYEKAASDLLTQYNTKFKPIMEQAVKAGPPPAMVKNPLSQGAQEGARANYIFNPASGRLEAAQ